MYTDEQNEEEIDEIINQEYKVWKYNSHYLYDTLFISAVEWPSLTLSWLPDYEINDGIITQKLVIGTHTSSNEQNYLLICKIKFPEQKEEKISQEISNLFYDKEDIEKYKKIPKKLEVEYRINHQGEINRARPMPQKNKSNIIATKCPNGEIHIFDYLKHPKKPTDMQVKPEMRLTGHTKEGFGLNWNTIKEGYLISGSDDNRICVWDIGKNDEKNCLINTYESHMGVVEDVCFNKIEENIFASCGDDRKMMIWDLRQQNPVFNIEAHVQEVNTIDFNPFNEYLLLTGSNDKTCALWDLRNLKKKLHNFKHHINDVINVKWNPFIMSMFASSSSDRRVDIWDLSNIGNNNTNGNSNAHSGKDKEKNKENNEEDFAPTELLFTHGGHTSRVADFDWNPNQELTIASFADDNIIQVWKMADKLYYED